MYKVISGNKVVDCKEEKVYNISGSHNWKEGQLIEEGKDFKFGMKERKINEKYHALDPNSKVVYPIPSVTNEEDELWSYVIEFIFLSDLSSEEKRERLKQHFTISRKPSSSSLHS
jgi:hypothetical protein